jgi:hypothetical protein
MEIENLAVTLKVVNGEYIVREPKSVEKNLHIGHIENVLNYYGKKGWILEQISADETELSFYRNKTHWLKRLVMRPTEIHRRRHIYKKGGKYDVGSDTPFGETSSFEGLYLDSKQEVINYLESKYGLTFICQSPEIKIGDEILIRMYFLK